MRQFAEASEIVLEFRSYAIIVQFERIKRLIAGAVLSWARAFGEFGATITFAGSFPGKTQTLPLSVYLALDTDPHQALVLALLMVAVSFGVLAALRDRWLGGGELMT